MPKASTIAEVITQLEDVIQWSRQNKSRIGYFASLYLRMTRAVQKGIANGSFEDGARMERLDVIFANRYLDAWQAYINNQPCPNAWCAAFDACKKSNLIVLQHLLLGINTHINLDLCIAAAETCPGNSINGLQNDFNKINAVIAAESEKVQLLLEKIWWPLKLLTRISNNREDAVLNFSIGIARECSWENALKLANGSTQFDGEYIKPVELLVLKIARRVINPGFLVSLLLKPVNFMENKNISTLIDILNE